MSGRAIRQPWTSFLSWQYSVKALSRTAVAACTPPTLIFLLFFCMTYWRKDDKIPLHCLKYHHYLPHYLGDWQLQLPSQLYKQAVSTEAWVAVMILHGMMMWVLQHQQFMIEALFFFFYSKICFGVTHRAAIAHTENCNFQWTVFLPKAASAFLSWVKYSKVLAETLSFRFLCA